MQGSGEVSHIHLVDENAGVSGPVEPTFISAGGQEGLSDLLVGGAGGSGVDVTQVDLPAQTTASCAVLFPEQLSDTWHFGHAPSVSPRRPKRPLNSDGGRVDSFAFQAKHAAVVSCIPAGEVVEDQVRVRQDIPPS